MNAEKGTHVKLKIKFTNVKFHIDRGFMYSDARRRLNESRQKDPAALLNRRQGSMLRPATKKEEAFLNTLSPSAKLAQGRELLSKPPLPHFKDVDPVQSAPEEPLSDADILITLDGSVLMDTTRSLDEIILEARSRMAATPKVVTPQQLEQLQGLNPAARIAQARRLNIL